MIKSSCAIIMVKYTCDQFDAIGTYYGTLLKNKAGIETVDDFLKMTSNGSNFTLVIAALNEPEKKRTRKLKVPPAIEINEMHLEKWSQIFDLFRIPIIAFVACELLFLSVVVSAFIISLFRITRCTLIIQAGNFRQIHIKPLGFSRFR